MLPMYQRRKHHYQMKIKTYHATNKISVAPSQMDRVSNFFAYGTDNWTDALTPNFGKELRLTFIDLVLFTLISPHFKETGYPSEENKPLVEQSDPEDDTFSQTTNYKV